MCRAMTAGKRHATYISHVRGVGRIINKRSQSVICRWALSRQFRLDRQGLTCIIIWAIRVHESMSLVHPRKCTHIRPFECYANPSLIVIMGRGGEEKVALQKCLVLHGKLQLKRSNQQPKKYSKQYSNEN